MEMRLECLRKVVERHPALTSVQVAYRSECVLVKLVSRRGEQWIGVHDAGWASGGDGGGFTDGESRVGVDLAMVWAHSVPWPVVVRAV